MLRVVEVHRTAYGGWELLEGAPRLLHTVDTGGGGVFGAAAATPTLVPMAALFTECLQQDSQMDAVIERELGAAEGTLVCAKMPASKQAPAAGRLASRVLSLASMPAAVANTGGEPLSQQGMAQALVEISPPAAAPAAPGTGQQQAQASPPGLRGARLLAQAQPAVPQRSRQPAGQVGSETQPDMPACGLLRQLSQVPATPSDPQEQVEETEEGEPAGVDLLGADGAAAFAAAAAAAPTPPLLTPASHARQHPAEHAQHAVLPAPLQLQFGPDTLLDPLLGTQQRDAGSLPCVQETLADELLPQLALEAAAKLPMTGALAPDGSQQEQQQAQQRQQFVPDTDAAELLAELAAAYPQQHAQQLAAVSEKAVDQAQVRHLFVEATASPADALPATPADELAAHAAQQPGSMVSLPAPLPGQPPAAMPQALTPLGMAAPQPQPLAPLAQPDPQQHLPHRHQQRQGPAAGAGLQDFDVVVEAPASGAAAAAGDGPPGVVCV